nr:hypothetical protein B11C_10117 [Bartonella sp. 1-1C]
MPYQTAKICLAKAETHPSPNKIIHPPLRIVLSTTLLTKMINKIYLV